MPPSNKSQNCAKHSISMIRSTESERGRKNVVRQPTRDLDEYRPPIWDWGSTQTPLSGLGGRQHRQFMYVKQASRHLRYIHPYRPEYRCINDSASVEVWKVSPIASITRVARRTRHQGAGTCRAPCADCVPSICAVERFTIHHRAASEQVKLL